MSTTADPYRTLGLTPAATPDEVKRAYRRLAKLYHPDSTGGAATARFIAIQRAYEALIVALSEGGTSRRPGTSTPRRSTGGRPGPGSRPGPPPWQADPERARATREGGSGTRQREQGGRGPRDGGPGAREGTTGPRERPPRADRGAPRARPGSTSYDGADAEALHPEWNGATWYGPASGTYWTVNPKEYADPRKHGPEYLARGRRLTAGRLDPAGADPAGADPTEASVAGHAPAAGPADTRPADDVRASPAPHGPPTAAPHGRSRESSRQGRRLPSPVALPERVLLAVLGWLVLGLAAANLIGDASGCARFSATCPEPVALVTILVQPLIVALLLAAPRLAQAAALGTIAVVVAAIPAAVLLSAMGGASAPAGQATTGLGLLLAIPYLAAFAGGISGRLRVPILAGTRVR